jgi:hypothetical protein
MGKTSLFTSTTGFAGCRAIQTKRVQHVLMRRWRAQNAAWGSAYREKLMVDVINKMDPKAVEDLRKKGLL